MKDNARCLDKEDGCETGAGLTLVTHPSYRTTNGFATQITTFLNLLSYSQLLFCLNI